MGNLQKMSIPIPQTALGDSLNWNFEGIGVLTIGILKALGGFRSGNSRGYRQECVP